MCNWISFDYQDSFEDLIVITSIVELKYKIEHGNSSRAQKQFKEEEIKNT